MAITADSVIVELEARVAGYNAAIADAANRTNAAMGNIGKSAAGAENAVVVSAGRMANAQRNLGRQFADVGASLSSGSSPFVILAQQAPQVADALSDTGGKAAKVAAFFAGPWGAALLAAGSVLAVFAEKALKTGQNVESLVAKLEQEARQTALNEQAHRIFATTTEGLSQSIRELSVALDQESASSQRATFMTLAKAEADRAASIEARRRAVSELALATALADGATTKNIFAGGPGGAQSIVSQQYAAQQEISARKLARAEAELAKAESNVVKARAPIIRNQVAEAHDAGARAAGRYERQLDLLYSKLKRGAITEAQYRAGVDQATTRRDAAIAADRDAKRKPRGASAETLAKRAEAQRVREVRDTEAFNRELEQANGNLISAKLSEAKDAGEIANLKRQQVASELDRKLIAIQADEDAKKYSALQASTLREKERELAALKNIAISDEEIRARADEQLRSAGVLANNQQTLASAQLAIAESSEERKRIEQQLLDIKYRELELAQKAILSDTTGRYTQAQRADAQNTLNNLPAVKRAEQVGIEQRYRGRYDQFRRDIESADMLADSIDGIKIETLDAVTDSLANATTAALGLKGAFGDIVGELVRIGIQRRLIGPLADALFGKADGGGSGILGSLIGSIAGAPGRASGGNVQAGRIYKINENGPELFSPSQSGKIYPTGALAGAAGRANGSTTIVSAPQFNLRGAVVTQELYRDMQRISAESATQAARAAYDKSPSRAERLSILGT